MTDERDAGTAGLVGARRCAAFESQQMSGSELISRIGSIVLVAVAAAGAIACNAQITPTTSPSALVLSPCPDAGPQETPPGVPEPVPTGNGLFRFCGQVTIERTEAWPRTIQVGVTSNRPEGPFQNRIPLVYHPGGPGISAVSELFNSPPDIDFNEHSLLTWDGATSGDGTGACGVDTVKFLTERTNEDFAELGAAAGDECQGGFGSALDVGAWAAADELETIRAALGIEQFDLLTISYGTAIAEAYMRWHPEHVRRAVLDAPIGLGVRWRDRIEAVGSVSSLLADAMAVACVTDRCKTALSGVADDQAYETLRAAVLAANPTVGSGSLQLTPVMLDQATLLAIHSAAYWPGWAIAVDEGLGGDGSLLWQGAEHSYLDLDRQIYYRSLCADLDHPTDSSDFGEEQEPLAFTYASDLTPCVQFPRGVQPDSLAGEDAPRPNVQIYTSTRDPLAPADMLGSAPFLANMGRFCVSNLPGHTSYADEARRASMLAFLESGQSGC